MFLNLLPSQSPGETELCQLHIWGWGQLLVPAATSCWTVRLTPSQREQNWLFKHDDSHKTSENHPEGPIRQPQLYWIAETTSHASSHTCICFPALQNLKAPRLPRSQTLSSCICLSSVTTPVKVPFWPFVTVHCIDWQFKMGEWSWSHGTP